MITRDSIEKRKETLSEDIKNVKLRLEEYEKKKLEDIALLNGLSGAFQQCDAFVKELARPGLSYQAFALQLVETSLFAFLIGYRERDDPLVLHLADGQRGANRVDVGRGGQLLDDECLECGQVAGNAMQQEVRFPRDHPGRPNDRPGPRQFGEDAQFGFRLVVQADEAEGDDVEAEHRGVDHGAVAANDAGLLEPLYPPEARRCRYADAARKLDIGDAALLLQLAQDLPVDGIEISLDRHGDVRGPCTRIFGWV